MKLVDFLIMLLQAHGDSLKRLAALLGEDEFVEILENSGEDAAEVHTLLKPSELMHKKLEVALTSDAYKKIAGAVMEMNLPKLLEFHIWAYPHYRAFIESPLDLNAEIQGPGTDTGLALVEEAIQQSQAWFKQLQIPVERVATAERAAQIPWIRFRTELLKKIGRRPLHAVY